MFVGHDDTTAHTDCRQLLRDPCASSVVAGVVVDVVSVAGHYECQQQTVTG